MNFVQNSMGGREVNKINTLSKNKPKGLKVAKEVLMSIGSMVARLDD